MNEFYGTGKAEAITEDGKEILRDMIKRIYPLKIAYEILSVQPMDKAIEAFQKIYQNAVSEEELIAEGYEPVENQGMSLLWIKKP